MHLTTKLSAAALTLAAGLALTSTAGAQENVGENPLRRGASSLMVSISPEVEVGYWVMPSGRTTLGLVGGVQRSELESGENKAHQTQLVISPQAKRYWSTDGAVLPYLHGSVYATLVDYEHAHTSSSDSNVFGGSLAAGLDWFPVNRISFGGHAGVNLNHETYVFTNADGDRQESSTWAFQTFTAAIRVHLYL